MSNSPEKSISQRAEAGLSEQTHQWQLIPIAIIMIGCEWVLAGVNLLSDAPVWIFGIASIVAGTVAVVVALGLLFSANDSV